MSIRKQPVATPRDETLVSSIANALPEEITEATVRAVLDTMALIREGDEIGTIRVDGETGAVAVRVDDDGVPLWRCTGRDGKQWNDMRPSLDWPVVGGE